MTRAFYNVDWKMLRKQKETLFKLVYRKMVPPQAMEDIVGVLNLLDHYMDTAVAEGYATEQQVFGRKYRTVKPQKRIKR